jgi:hypothetical protein
MIHCATAKAKYKLPQKQVYVGFIILVDTAGKRAKQKMLSSLQSFVTLMAWLSL